MKITVLGSGHGGFAMSSDLKYSGYDVVLSSIAPHNSKLKLFKSLGQIKIEGMTEKYKNSVIIPTNFIEENTIKEIKRADIIIPEGSHNLVAMDLLITKIASIIEHKQNANWQFEVIVWE